MTLVLRPLTAPSLVDLGRAGVVRAALVVQEVGLWGTGPLRVEYLRPVNNEEGNGDDNGRLARNGPPGGRVGGLSAAVERDD